MRRRSDAREPDLAADPNASLNDRIAASEKAMLEVALRRHNNNRTATAKSLGLSRVGLYSKMRKHGMIEHHADR